MVMPRSERTEQVVDTLDPGRIRIVFLPLFFTYSGLNTRFGLFTDPALLTLRAVCVVLAIGGKFGACWAAARLRGRAGRRWRSRSAR